MIASQTILNIIKYRKSKVFVLFKGKEERERQVEKLHEWWDKGFITPFEIDSYTLGDLDYEWIENAVNQRYYNGGKYHDFIEDMYIYEGVVSTNEWQYYLENLFNPYNLDMIDEYDYWNGYAIPDPEDPEEYISIDGTYRLLLIIRNRLWAEYGEIHVPW